MIYTSRPLSRTPSCRLERMLVSGQRYILITHDPIPFSVAQGIFWLFWEWLLHMDEWTVKTPNPICRLFFSFNWPVNRFCGILFNRFYRLEIHSLMVCIFDTACELLPPWTKELYLCTVAPLLYLLSDLPPLSLPKLNTQNIQTVCGCGGGVEGRWNVLWTVDHILQEFYTLLLTRFRTYKIASPPLTKMTSKDDIVGLVSLKFLRPCSYICNSLHSVEGGVFSCSHDNSRKSYPGPCNRYVLHWPLCEDSDKITIKAVVK